jgi:hypothetical protein
MTQTQIINRALRSDGPEYGCQVRTDDGIVTVHCRVESTVDHVVGGALHSFRATARAELHEDAGERPAYYGTLIATGALLAAGEGEDGPKEAWGHEWQDVEQATARSAIARALSALPITA